MEANHKHKITQGKDGKWRTYIKQENSKLKLLVKNTEDDLYECIYNFYTYGSEKINATKPKSTTKDSRDVTQCKEIKVFNIKEGLYLISPIGDIYSVSAKRWKAFEILDKTDTYAGNKYTLLQTYNGEKLFNIARLVCAVFNGLPPEDMKNPSVDHIDFNSMNNHYTNLRWLEHGTNASIRDNRAVGEQNGRSILTEEQVIYICNSLIKKTKTIDQLCEMYHVSKGCIDNIIKHKNWSYISRWFQFD